MKIEKGIPAPKKEGRGRKSKYPWGDMDVGDSVFFDICVVGGIGKEQASAHQYGKYHGKKFASRREDGGVRIWRTA